MNVGIYLSHEDFKNVYVHVCIYIYINYYMNSKNSYELLINQYTFKDIHYIYF